MKQVGLGFGVLSFRVNRERVREGEMGGGKTVEGCKNFFLVIFLLGGEGENVTGAAELTVSISLHFV